jgi:phosphoribosylamine--glycine ligase
MITSEGPKVVEFNCRMGDPETETILPLLETDFVEICKAILESRVNELELKWMSKTAVCVIAAGKDYPYQGSKGIPISFSAHMDAHAFYSAVDIIENELVTNGGRILAVTAVGNTKAEARTKVYHDLAKVFFDGMQFRSDIGLRENKL